MVRIVLFLYGRSGCARYACGAAHPAATMRKAASRHASRTGRSALRPEGQDDRSRKRNTLFSPFTMRSGPRYPSVRSADSRDTGGQRPTCSFPADHAFILLSHAAEHDPAHVVLELVCRLEGR